MELRSDFTVDVVEACMSDERVVQAARVSTQGGESRDAEASEGLIRYLLRNRHGTPFEHNSITFYIEAPIVVFREFHRHRIGWSYNEESGRYRELRPTFYAPPRSRPLAQQGNPGHYKFVPGSDEQFGAMDLAHQEAYEVCYAMYEKQLAAGVAKEVARNVLPVGIYSSMYATCNARSLMAFLSLRTREDHSLFKSYPAWEIEQVAGKMEQHWKQLMPITHDAFEQSGRVCP